MQVTRKQDRNIPSCMGIDRVESLGQHMKSFFFKNLFVLISLLALTACSSGKSSESQMTEQRGGAGVSATAAPAATGQYSVEIAPADATRRSTFFLVSKGFNLPEGKIEWLVDGLPAEGANASTFNAARTKKGAAIQARVTAKGMEMRSNAVMIKNSSPEITGGYFLLAGNNLTVDVTTTDADEDSITLTYGWTVNDKPAGTGKTLDAKVKRGDKISVRIVPSDGESEGRPVVLTSEARNMPPALAENKEVKFDGKVWTCQLNAVDHDEDPITFDIKAGPPGMTIDAKTGLMTWHVPEDFKGKTSCVAVLKDGHGGETNYTVNIDIGDAKK